MMNRTDADETAARLPQESEGPGARLSRAWKALTEAGSAQIEIWGMKAVRIAIMLLVAAVGALGLLALAISGVILLDRALDMALSGVLINGEPQTWLSPLVRGGIYFGVPLALFLVVWHATVGWGSVNEELEKDKVEALRERPGRLGEVGHAGI